jgi:hypothetical protein
MFAVLEDEAGRDPPFSFIYRKASMAAGAPMRSIRAAFSCGGSEWI